MKEIGGYIEFEKYGGKALHGELIGLNCGRSCLAYLIETKRIRAAALPLFLCESVKELCERQGLRIRYYRIGHSFLPEKLKLKSDEWLYVLNPYGQLTDEDIRSLKEEHRRVIVDNAQAFFEEPLPGVDTFYTCRKYFGVADGAWLSTDVKIPRLLPEDASAGRMDFLLGRFEGRASDFYGKYVENNAHFRNETVKSMSPLTENLLRGIDYPSVEQRRTRNFAALAQRLGPLNALQPRIPKGPFAYPLMVRGAGEIRKALIEKKIYVPLLWPNVLQEAEEESRDYRLAADVLPLPCDQRYTEEEMDYIADSVEELLT